jgi:hypothetical protein
MVNSDIRIRIRAYPMLIHPYLYRERKHAWSDEPGASGAQSPGHRPRSAAAFHIPGEKQVDHTT